MYYDNVIKLNNMYLLKLSVNSWLEVFEDTQKYSKEVSFNYKSREHLADSIALQSLLLKSYWSKQKSLRCSSFAVLQRSSQIYLFIHDGRSVLSNSVPNSISSELFRLQVEPLFEMLGWNSMKRLRQISSVGRSVQLYVDVLDIFQAGSILESSPFLRERGGLTTSNWTLETSSMSLFDSFRGACFPSEASSESHEPILSQSSYTDIITKLANRFAVGWREVKSRLACLESNTAAVRTCAGDHRHNQSNGAPQEDGRPSRAEPQRRK